MNKPQAHPAADLHEQMDDLITGQLPLIAAWRLRRQIARDPERTREWTQLQQLHADLQQLASVSNKAPLRKAVPSPTARNTIQIGAMVMKKRTVLVALAALSAFGVTGAIAERYLAPPLGAAGTAGENTGTEWWYAKGTFRGRVTIINKAGKQIRDMDITGSSDTGWVTVTLQRRSPKTPSTWRTEQTIVQQTIQGMGRHAIYGKNGALVGYIKLSPFNQKDNARLEKNKNEVIADFADYIQRPERATPNDGKRNFLSIVALPGVVGGTSLEYFTVHNVDGLRNYPYSWKSYGSVHVVARLRLKPKKVDVWFKKTRVSATLPKRTLVSESESGPIPTPEELRRLDPETREYMQALPVRRVTVPETYWQIAVNGGEYTPINNQGNWDHVLRSGCFKGYGHFEVHDPATGEVVLTLDVTPAREKDFLTFATTNRKQKESYTVPVW